MKQNENKERPGRVWQSVCRGRIAGLCRKKKNWDAWLDQEEEQQSEKELQVYLEEYSDPTLYLTPKEVKAWNRMPKSKQKRLLEKESRQVLQAWKVGERKGSAGGGRKADSMEELVFLQGRGTQRGTRSRDHRYMGFGSQKREAQRASGRRDQPLPQSPETQFPGCQTDTFKNRKTSGCRSAECGIFCCG